MLIPVRCFTCNGVIGHKWYIFDEKRRNYKNQGMTETQANDKALNEVGLLYDKYCCRQMMLGHVEVIDTMLRYEKNRDFRKSEY